MNMHGNRSLMSMEKRAVNKLGLFLIILIALAFFGGGGYLLYKNSNVLLTFMIICSTFVL